MERELIERLRKTGHIDYDLREAAADLIESLRAQLDEARRVHPVPGSEIASARENVRWVMQNLPIGFVMRDECPVDMLMHALGVLVALSAGREALEKESEE